MPITVDSNDPSDDVEVYTKPEVDAKFAALPGGENTYTKEQVDAKFSALPVPPTPIDAYTKAQVDAKFAALPAPAVTYTKTQVDQLFTTLRQDMTTALATKQDKIVPPPPPPTGTYFVSQPSDFNTLWYTPNPPTWAPAEISPFFTKINAPSGPGFQFVCSDVNTTPWNSGMSAVLLKKNNTTAVGQTQDWTFDVYVPSQTFGGQGQGGVWWEMHTDLSSGHHLGINPNNTWRFARQSAIGQVYVRDFNNGPAVVFNKWLQWRFWVKWSFGGDGFLRIYIDGVNYMNWSGPTQFSGDGEPKWQLGWYQWKSGQTNTLRVANIKRTVS